jgi:hypothetical protein
VIVMATSYSRVLSPAKYQVMGSTSTGMPASGIFAMHLTYPDTSYEDGGIEDWQYGINSNDWRQGLTVLIRTPMASSSSSVAEAKNVIAVDLKQAKADYDAKVAASSFYWPERSYNLGTEEATRFIAAKINARREKMEGENSMTKYLKASYVRQSLPQKYPISSFEYVNATTITVTFKGSARSGFPSEILRHGSLVTRGSGLGGGGSSPYIGPDPASLGPFGTVTQLVTTRVENIVLKEINTTTNTTTAELTIPASTYFYNSPTAGDTLDNTGFLQGGSEQHTIVLKWNYDATSVSSYWGSANCGPVVQGLGSTGLFNFVAKPMDGGNMGLPAINYESRNGIKATAHATNHGFSRFSIEGLNSCDLPAIPPSDYHITTPTIEGITEMHPSAETDIGSNRLRVHSESIEFGTTLPIKDIDASSSPTQSVGLTNGYSGSFSATINDAYESDSANGAHIQNYSMTSAHIKHGILSDNQVAYARPFVTTGRVNPTRVTGIQISNEERVFDDIEVIDDVGNALTLKGGSPFGTVIRDYEKIQNQIDSETGDISSEPTAPGSSVAPNMRIQLPKPEDIPGGIFVRSGHDRVQAWSNQTFGLGGLSAPNPRKAGFAESGGEASQFDTHDRMLIFHCERILHPSISKLGIDTNIGTGAVASGTTRLYSAHRMFDHVERGSVLTQTNNGVATGNPIPHHRIRFGRQGHSFVTPLTHRGTPLSLRRQLHRSHGSAYSLMFEAETEYKHFGFGSMKDTNSSTRLELDTIEAARSSSLAYYQRNAGSFRSDGLPLTEIEGVQLPDAVSAHSLTAGDVRTYPDYLFSPGQVHTNVEGSEQDVHFAKAEIDTAIAENPTRLALKGGSLTARNRFTVGSEFAMNGFMLNDHLGFGGRPEPISFVGVNEVGDYFLRGHHEGVIRPRVATELATVPPLIVHDPELTNMAGVPISTSASIPSSSWTTNAASADRGLIKKSDTSSGCVPDAFLCTWLAEYNHPSYFGTTREHFLTFRYREAGMPRSLNYPSTRGLLLRNHSNPTTTGQPVVADPFERLYIFQWLQNYGFNGLNAGGHGNTDGLRGAYSVLMGHTTIREPRGTIRLFAGESKNRYARGEGIGDSLNPNKTIGYVSDDFNNYYYSFDPTMGIDVSRRLPVRSWGIRTGSNALNMLAGDPTETQNTQAILKSGRFDGGTHDSMSAVPNATNHGTDWDNKASQENLPTSVPVGIVTSAHTVDPHPFVQNSRQSNEPLLANDEQIGFGRKFGMAELGMLSHHAMGAGMFDYKRIGDFDFEPMNTGSDPFIDLVQYEGKPVYPQTESPAAVFASASTHGASQPTDTYHLRGNALHCNVRSINNAADLMPPNGYGSLIRGTHPTTGEANMPAEIKPSHISEIADQRQIQSNTQPRLGLVMEVENERKNNTDIDYSIVGTRSVSLHSDLAIGYARPVLPSNMINTHFTTHGMTTRSSTTRTYSQVITRTNTIQTTKPTWSPDSNTGKSTSPLSDTVVQTPHSHALDTWAVRGSADLPAWGGTYILRKTYLNRDDDVYLYKTEVNGGSAQASHPHVKYVDYLIRPVRPLKLYGFASDLIDDGWCNGARVNNLLSATYASQAFTRDKRYGIFEINYDRALGDIEPITSIGDALVMEYPDANNYDVVYHLIPTANMLQFFKSDAHRFDDAGVMSAEVEARYSQATVSGGYETIHQSQTSFSVYDGVIGDHAKHDGNRTRLQSKESLRLYPRIKIETNIGSGVYGLDDGSVFPSTGGKIFTLDHTGSLTYTSISDNQITISSGSIVDASGATISEYVGMTFYFTDVASSTGKLVDARSPTNRFPIAPSFVDNSVIAMKIQSHTWRHYERDIDQVVKTRLNYKGILHYDPTDFLMLSQSPMILSDGIEKARINSAGGIRDIQFDNRPLSNTNFPPYLFDKNGEKLRVSSSEKIALDNTLTFKNLEDKKISSVFEVGEVLGGQYGSVGIRATDAALHLLGDVVGDNYGISLLTTDQMFSDDMEVKNRISAHPMLRQASQHSNRYVARQTKGLNTMDVIRNLSQLDGRQIVLENGGTIVYSNNVFRENDFRITQESGATQVRVSKLFDSPNEIVIVGDVIAQNEIVYVKVSDSEKMMKMGGGEEGVIRTLHQSIPGLKDFNEARKLAKALLSRAENGAPLIKIEGLMNSTALRAGDVVNINLPIHGVIGLFVVFETEHHNSKGMTNIVVAQYEKGIEGILSDIKTDSRDTRRSGSNKEKSEKDLLFSTNVKIVAVHRVRVRNNNNTHMVIGAKHKNGLGKIGVRDGSKRAYPIGMSKSRTRVVK